MPWKPGESGNPAGRGTEKLFRLALLRELRDDQDPLGKLSAVAKTLVTAAIAGDIAAAREIADRVDGKVPQPIRGEGDDGKIEIVIRHFAAALDEQVVIEHEKLPKPS